MPVVFARVDDRLIHGQVVEGWVPYCNAQTIYVVDDEISRDKSRCRLMRMIVPSCIGLCVVTPVELEMALKDDQGRRIMILFNSLTSLSAAVDCGFFTGHVNIGNIHNLRGGREFTQSIFLNREDISHVRKLHKIGISLEAREVPDGRCLNLYDLLSSGNSDS